MLYPIGSFELFQADLGELRDDPESGEYDAKTYLKTTPYRYFLAVIGE